MVGAIQKIDMCVYKYVCTHTHIHTHNEWGTQRCK